MKKEWFSVQNVLTIIVLLAVGYFIITLKLENNRLLNTLVVLQNKLAEHDSLTSVLLEDNKVLQERYASIQKDYSSILEKNKGLKRYLEEKDARILFLTARVTELKIENEQIKGSVVRDSAGTVQIVFSKITDSYSLESSVTFDKDSTSKIIKDSPKMLITSLSIPDSSYVGLIEQGDGTLSGFVVHSNPHILDTQASFSINPKNYGYTKGWSPWVVGIIGGATTVGAFFLGRAIVR